VYNPGLYRRYELLNLYKFHDMTSKYCILQYNIISHGHTPVPYTEIQNILYYGNMQLSGVVIITALTVVTPQYLPYGGKNEERLGPNHCTH
jgi:hypothetical protein